MREHEPVHEPAGKSRATPAARDAARQLLATQQRKLALLDKLEGMELDAPGIRVMLCTPSYELLLDEETHLELLRRGRAAVLADLILDLADLLDSNHT